MFFPPNRSKCHKRNSSKRNSKAKIFVTKDDFEFLKVIGRGSFGKVMQVKKKDTNEIFALKILKKKSIIARKQVEHTKSERLILQQLQHPFLMKLRYAFQTDIKLYFVLDYYRGGELFFHLKKKRRFKENEAKFIVAEVALALGYLHSLFVIYRDLKPENILLDIDGHICLTDFGLSKQQNYDLISSPKKSAVDIKRFSDCFEPQLAHTFCGTPEYLAPEIVCNVGHTKAVDWWSLGILLYELTVGIPPFYSQNISEMYNKIQSAPLQFPPQSSITLKHMVCLLLERDPVIRLGSGFHDVEEIKRQPFFGDIDWKALYNKDIEPVYQPSTATRDADDSSCFDSQFTDEKPVDSYGGSLNLNVSNAAKIFSDFGYTEDYDQDQ